MCWYWNWNKSNKDSPPKVCLRLFCMRFSSPSPHPPPLSDSGASDFREQHSSVNGKKTNKQSKSPVNLFCCRHWQEMSSCEITRDAWAVWRNKLLASWYLDRYLDEWWRPCMNVLFLCRGTLVCAATPFINALCWVNLSIQHVKSNANTHAAKYIKNPAQKKKRVSSSIGNFLGDINLFIRPLYYYSFSFPVSCEVSWLL